jgi:hypothetical protein
LYRGFETRENPGLSVPADLETGEPKLGLPSRFGNPRHAGFASVSQSSYEIWEECQI